MKRLSMGAVFTNLQTALLGTGAFVAGVLVAGGAAGSRGRGNGGVGAGIDLNAGGGAGR